MAGITGTPESGGSDMALEFGQLGAWNDPDRMAKVRKKGDEVRDQRYEALKNFDVGGVGGRRGVEEGVRHKMGFV